MVSYMKMHEQNLRKLLDDMTAVNTDNSRNLLQLYQYHNLQVQWLQHERLIHLLVTLFTAALVLAFAMASILLSNLLFLLLFMITAILLVFYIVHYYRLENGIQHWYVLSNEIQVKLREQR